MDNKIIENIKMVTRYDWIADKKLGHLELKQIPVPGSITVYLNGHLIQPESFDACGSPIISAEMTKLFTSRQHLAFRNDPKNNTEDIYARVSYEPQDFTVPKEDFDSISGIQKSLANLKDFNEMVNNRLRYLKASGDKAELSEYIIWGKFILEKSGEVTKWNGTVRNQSTGKLTTLESVSSLPDVCELSILDFFLKEDEIIWTGPEFHVPVPGSICPICGREISMYDIRTREFNRIGGRICHQKCIDDYERQLQFDRVVNLIDKVYDGTPKYTIVEEEGGLISLLFETADGDIEIQDSFGVISIEWKENFKPFNMSLFKNETTLKWYNINGELKLLGVNIHPNSTFPNSARGILARKNYNKAEDYLIRVKETVNETK